MSHSRVGWEMCHTRTGQIQFLLAAMTSVTRGKCFHICCCLLHLHPSSHTLSSLCGRCRVQEDYRGLCHYIFPSHNHKLDTLMKKRLCLLEQTLCDLVTKKGLYHALTLAWHLVLESSPLKYSGRRLNAGLFCVHKSDIFSISKSEVFHMNPMCHQGTGTLPLLQGCLPFEQLLIAVCAFSSNETVHM